MTAPNDIFLPAIALMLWTFIVSMRMVLDRVQAAKKGDVDPRYYKTYRDNTGVPDKIIKMGNHYNNLFQMPIFFYLLVIMIYVTETVDSFFIVLAWLFVASRIAHTFIHLKRNNPLYRMQAFAAGVVVLVLMLLKFAVGIAG